MASVREGIDYSETIHNYLSTRPSDIIMQILQVRFSSLTCCHVDPADVCSWREKSSVFSSPAWSASWQPSSPGSPSTASLTAASAWRGSSLTGWFTDKSSHSKLGNFWDCIFALYFWKLSSPFSVCINFHL